MKRFLRELFESAIVTISSNVSGQAGVRLRRLFYPFLFGSFGKNVTFGCGLRIRNPEHIYISDNVWIDDYTLLVAGRMTAGKRHVHRKETLQGLAEEGSDWIDDCPKI